METTINSREWWNSFKNTITRKGRNCQKNVNAKIYNEDKAYSAKNAYMHSKYGRTLSQKDLLQKFFRDVNAIIASKCMSGTYCCMVEIDNDIKEFMPKIVAYFKDKLGYKLAIIDNDTEIISNKEQTTSVKLQPNSTFIILMWNDANISEEVFIENAEEKTES